jgi:hypothetical protein
MFGHNYKSLYCLDSDSDSSDDDNTSLNNSNKILNRTIMPEPNRSWLYYLTCQFLCKKIPFLKQLRSTKIYNSNLDECD